MSKHSELFLCVNVEWDKDTGTLDIRDQEGNQLALLYATGED